ncbi:MAG: hypothetical protein KDA05_01100, partial [Phycisphaerales bacterium]|nr:hypothetical protein [Phycisphaerales bacterium]
MGRQDVDRRSDGERDTAFTRALLNDLRALERMHEQGLIERGVRRIGAEQELVLVDRHWAPCPLGPEILARITDPRVTTELALFNLECNLDPLTLGGACLARMEAGLRQVLGVVQQAAAEFEATVVLTGILPTLALSDLSSQNITPRPRYFAIDEAVRRIRGGPYELRIKGADDLSVTNESIMLEALNTSFQVHYQVSDQEFPALFNIAQAIAAPTLAAAANSPILFGKRLWHETRIAIFQQVVETRSNRTPGREGLARVRFGEGWVEHSVLEVFRSDVSRFRALIGADAEEDSLAALDQGRIPRLRALQTFNGTVYRWNRPCYGVTDGKPHLRIENRVLPA